MDCNPKLCSLDKKQRGADCCAGTAGGMKGKIKRDGESREEVCGQRVRGAAEESREKEENEEEEKGESRFVVGT